MPSSALLSPESTKESVLQENCSIPRVNELWPELCESENEINLARIFSVASSITRDDTELQHPLLSVYEGLSMLSTGKLSLNQAQLDASWQLLMQLAEEEIARLNRERSERETRKKQKPSAGAEITLRLPPPVELNDTRRGLYKQLTMAGFSYDHDRQLWRAWADDNTRALKQSLKYQQQTLI